MHVSFSQDWTYEDVFMQTNSEFSWSFMPTNLKASVKIQENLQIGGSNKIKINFCLSFRLLRASVWVKLWQNFREQNSKLWDDYNLKEKNLKPLAVRHYVFLVVETYQMWRSGHELLNYHYPMPLRTKWNDITIHYLLNFSDIFWAQNHLLLSRKIS